MQFRSSQFGMTLVEILVVIAIFGILVSLALFFGMDFFRTYSFNAEQVNVASVLSKARARSLANVNQNEHGVHIEDNKLILFQGDGPSLTWGTRDTGADEEVAASSGLNISNQDVVFDQLSGNTGCSTDCVITLSGLGNSKTITVTSQGTIIW